MTYCEFIVTALDNKRKIHKKYHDLEYGFPIHDDNELFARLILEIKMHIAILILKKLQHIQI